MKNYVTKKDGKELWNLWKQIELNLRSMHKEHKPLEELKFKVITVKLNQFIQNEHWRRKYKKAPSYMCKLYIALQYCRSLEAFTKMKDTLLQDECMTAEWWIEYNLTIEDYEYMRDNVASMGQSKAVYNDIIKLFKSLKNGDQFTIQPHGREDYNPNYIEKYNRR